MSTRVAAERPILVTGATGAHGGTGRVVVQELRARGVPVRALVRVDDARAAALRSLGAEVVVGDLHDRRSLLPALEGVSAAYFTYPVREGVVEAAAQFAAAARAAELPRLVVMSMAVAHPEHPSPFGRQHGLAEEIFGWAGLTTLSLRIGALFSENLFLLHGDDLRGDGVLRNAFADVPVPWMSGEDAGRVAAAALLHPERFGGPGGVVFPMATHLLSHAQVARILGTHLAREVRHETISPDAWTRLLVAASVHDPRINPLMAAHIAATAVALSRPRANAPKEMPSFPSLTGQAPQPFEEALAVGISALRG